MDKHWAIVATETLDLMAEESAYLTLRGVGLNAQPKVLAQKFPGVDVTRTLVVTLKRRPKYKEVFKAAAEEMISDGQIELKTGAADLVPAVIECLREKVKDGDVKAASLVFNILTDQKDDDGPKQAQQLQIIMPGAAPKDVK